MRKATPRLGDLISLRRPVVFNLTEKHYINARELAAFSDIEPLVCQVDGYVTQDGDLVFGETDKPISGFIYVPPRDADGAVQTNGDDNQAAPVPELWMIAEGNVGDVVLTAEEVGH